MERDICFKRGVGLVRTGALNNSCRLVISDANSLRLGFTFPSFSIACISLAMLAELALDVNAARWKTKG